MMELQKVILHQNKTFSIKRQHPWIFSGAILKKDHKISDGDMVDVFDEQGPSAPKVKQIIELEKEARK